MGAEAELPMREQDEPARIDPVTLEVLRGQLDNVAAEMQLIILKSSHSTIVSESLDATSAVFDRQGRTTAQAVAIPIHLGVLAELGRRFAAAYPEGVAEPGDVYAINDPYAGGTHLPDFAVASPVFFNGALVGYVVTMTHHQDIGGSVPGSTAVQVHDHFAEGLRLPMVRLVAGGRRNADLLELMFANSRTPDNMRGDLNAQIAACETGVERTAALFERWGRATVEAAVNALLDYAERLTRREIERIPDGDYEFEDFMDDDGSGADAGPVRFKLRVRVQGSNIHFDFTGTAPEVKTAINNVPASTISAVYYAVRVLTGDSAPNNDGCYRPVTVELPPGSIVNPNFPAPINARSVCLRRGDRHGARRHGPSHPGAHDGGALRAKLPDSRRHSGPGHRAQNRRHRGRPVDGGHGCQGHQGRHRRDRSRRLQRLSHAGGDQRGPSCRCCSTKWSFGGTPAAPANGAVASATTPSLSGAAPRAPPPCAGTGIALHPGAYWAGIAAPCAEPP